MGNARALVGTTLATVVAATVLAATPALAAPVDGAPPDRYTSTAATALVFRWSDGDTVVTDLGTVRLIGVDTPERSECGHDAATRVAERLAPAGTLVTLRDPTSVRPTDSYGRLLRYVGVDGRDVGLQQIRAGSQARYDSTDGYDRHPRQRTYRRQDVRHRDHCGSRDLQAYPPASATSCPGRAPIKGNRGEEWIYHLPSDRYYDVTRPEQCFASADGAKKAGYRAALV